MGLGPMELVIILIVALLLFGGSRLAGVGKGVGRSIREFREEVQPLTQKDKTETVDAEIVTDPRPTDADRARELDAREARLSEAERARELDAREAELRAREEEIRLQNESRDVR